MHLFYERERAFGKEWHEKPKEHLYKLFFLLDRDVFLSYWREGRPVHLPEKAKNDVHLKFQSVSTMAFNMCVLLRTVYQFIRLALLDPTSSQYAQREYYAYKDLSFSLTRYEAFTRTLV